jgi:hypothetical protein
LEKTNTQQIFTKSEISNHLNASFARRQASVVPASTSAPPELPGCTGMLI